MKKERRQKMMDTLWMVILLGMIVLCIFPVITASFYTVAVSDEFAQANTISDNYSNFWGYAANCIQFAKNWYFQYGGIYFSSFLTALFSPLKYFDLSDLRIIMVVNALLTYGSLFFFIFSLGQAFQKTTKIQWKPFPLFLSACALYMMSAYSVHEEIFFWYTTAASYSIPLSLILISLGCYIRYLSGGSRGLLFPTCLLGFLGVGGSNAISGTGCYLFLLISAFTCLKEKKIRKDCAFVMAVLIGGALINVSAPGNFSRHAMMDETGLHPVLAFGYAIVEEMKRIQWFNQTTNYLAILGMILVVSFILGKGKPLPGAYPVISLAAFLLPVVTGFPIALGYSSGSFPDRQQFLLDLDTVLAFGNGAFLIGNYLGNSFKEQEIRKLFCVTAIMGIFTILFTSNMDILNSASYQIFHELYRGSYQRYHAEYIDFISGLESRKGEDVVLTAAEFPEPIPCYYNFFLEEKPEDPYYWVNISVSQYYGLNSISLVKHTETAAP